MVPTAWLRWYGTEKEAVLYHGTNATVATVVLFPNADDGTCMPEMSLRMVFFPPPTTLIHHSKNPAKSCTMLSSYSFYLFLMNTFSSAKNSSIGLRSGEWL
jgi:hypothetical protein